MKPRGIIRRLNTHRHILARKLLGRPNNKRRRAAIGALAGSELASVVDAATYSDPDDKVTGLAKFIPGMSVINSGINLWNNSHADTSGMDEEELHKHLAAFRRNAMRLGMGLVGPIIPAGAATAGISSMTGALGTDLGVEAVLSGVKTWQLSMDDLKLLIDALAATEKLKALNIAAQTEADKKLNKARSKQIAQEMQMHLEAIKNDRLRTLLTAGAGTLALGGAGYALYKWLDDREEERASRTRMKMKLETPDGKDAIVDLPINNPELSGKLAEEFNRGVTRTVRRTARYNSLKKDPATNKFIPYPTWLKKYPNGIELAEKAVGINNGDDYTYKAAALQGMPKYNLVDGYADKAPKMVYDDNSKSSMVRRFLDSFSLNKQASALDAKQSTLGEIFGSVAGPTIAGLGTGLIANKLFGVSPAKSVALGAGATVATPLIGMAASAITPNREQAELEMHDNDSNGLLNALVPGLALYNLLKRIHAIPSQTGQIEGGSINSSDIQLELSESSSYEGKPVVKNKKLTLSKAVSSDFDDDDDF